MDRGIKTTTKKQYVQKNAVKEHNSAVQQSLAVYADVVLTGYMIKINLNMTQSPRMKTGYFIIIFPLLTHFRARSS